MPELSPVGNTSEKSGLTLPAYVLMRPEGVFINLSPPPAQDILRLFVDRLFSNEARFEGLDYARFLCLLYGAISEVAGNAKEIRIANSIVRFPPQRRELYKGVNITDSGDRAEYMFEPVFIEVITEEPANIINPEGSGGEAKKIRKAELCPTELDFDEFVADIWLKGVRFGIDADAVRDAIKRGLATRMDIAFQLEPTESKDAQVVEESDLLRQDNAPLILPNGKADLRRAKNRFPQVAKNTPLLRKIPRMPGKPGYKVTGTIIEPRLPEDIDLNKLAGEGTRIDQTPKGELLVAAMDGFVCLDEGSSKIAITAKIENKGGVSARSTGDIKLTVDEFTEHGEVQEGRIVEGKHMTFRSDVFGTVISKDGNLRLNSNIAGGHAKSIGCDITIKGRASNAILEACDGKITAGIVESCTIMGKTVCIERAVNCEIVAEELQLGSAEGCAIAGTNIKIASANSRKHRETVITILLPDLTAFDKQIVEARNSLTQIKNALQARSREIAAASSDPGFAKYMAISAKIQEGSIKLTASQQEDWQKLIDKYSPVLKGSDVLVKRQSALEEAIERLSQARAASGDNVGCEIAAVLGDTVVRKQVSREGISAFYSLPVQELRARLQHLGAPEERIFSKHSGSFKWNFQMPEALPASA